jgi:hypothetical protein
MFCISASGVNADCCGIDFCVGRLLNIPCDTSDFTKHVTDVSGFGMEALNGRTL